MLPHFVVIFPEWLLESYVVSRDYASLHVFLMKVMFLSFLVATQHFASRRHKSQS